MPTKLAAKEWKALTAEVTPVIESWINDHADVLTPKGRKFAERAVAKGNLAGDAGTRQLFEPVLLIATAAEPLDIDRIFEECDRIPFTGNYLQWEYVRATYAAAYRIYHRAGDEAKAEHPRLMLSYPENNEQRADPFATRPEVVRNRANGSALGHSANYPRPATTVPALQHLLGAVREWTIMWAYGSSDVWPREKLDASLTEANSSASSFVTQR
ncbi:MAG: hypothetical protein CME34_05045 [Gordonia sp.]|uniref:hypothetical protein n=1 Tax=Gordonia sp. (in: high G+C Gram-positive bacteria) TaxID=84139 RepID=UPI000C3EE739|nr:hypothetical protein [Gordonia sp. (in: high G+C Gram-positive bacteria)]MAU81232.1 hypothetical protein [Gordonia sp. (in: high G+C Gram-positive bacteria)]